MLRKVPVLFIAYMALWAALGSCLDIQRLAVGTLFSMAAAIVSARYMPQRITRFAHPYRVFWFAVYVCMILGDLIRAAALNGLSLLMPVVSGTGHRITAKTGILSAPGKLLLANALNLAAETMCIDIENDGIMNIYACTPHGIDAQTVVAALVRRYETVIRKVCD